MRRLVLVGLCAMLALSACGGDEEPAGSGSTPTPTQTTSPSPTMSAIGTVNVASSSLGQILVDAEGLTLYLFLNDSGGQSNCTDACATTWPPLVVNGPPAAGLGVNAALLATIPRTGGSTQVTYNGHPLYRFASDAAPGDTKGQGIGGNWFVVSPSGDAIRS